MTDTATERPAAALPPPPELTDDELRLLRSYERGPRIWDAAAVLPKVLALHDRGLIEPAHGAAFRLTVLGRQVLARAEGKNRP